MHEIRDPADAPKWDRRNREYIVWSLGHGHQRLGRVHRREPQRDKPPLGGGTRLRPVEHPRQRRLSWNH